MIRNLKNAPKYSSQSATDRTPYWQQDHSFLTFRMLSNYEITFSRNNLSTNQPFSALSSRPIFISISTYATEGIREGGAVLKKFQQKPPQSVYS